MPKKFTIMIKKSDYFFFFILIVKEYISTNGCVPSGEWGFVIIVRVENDERRRDALYLSPQKSFHV